MATRRSYWYYYYKKMSTYPPCSEVTFNLYKEEEEDERHKRQTLKFAHFLCFVGLTTTKRWHKYWQWFAITIKVSSNNTWWWGVILFDQITGEDGHWGALLLRDLLRLLLLCSFVNKVLHSVDLFNSHLCRMWYLNWWIIIVIERQRMILDRVKTWEEIINIAIKL